MVATCRWRLAWWLPTSAAVPSDETSSVGAVHGAVFLIRLHYERHTRSWAVCGWRMETGWLRGGGAVIRCVGLPYQGVQGFWSLVLVAFSWSQLGHRSVCIRVGGAFIDGGLCGSSYSYSAILHLRGVLCSHAMWPAGPCDVIYTKQ